VIASRATTCLLSHSANLLGFCCWLRIVVYGYKSVAIKPRRWPLCRHAGGKTLASHGHGALRLWHQTRPAGARLQAGSGPWHSSGRPGLSPKPKRRCCRSGLAADRTRLVQMHAEICQRQDMWSCHSVSLRLRQALTLLQRGCCAGAAGGVTGITVLPLETPAAGVEACTWPAHAQSRLDFERLALLVRYAGLSCMH